MPGWGTSYTIECTEGKHPTVARTCTAARAAPEGVRDGDRPREGPGVGALADGGPPPGF
ncbi:protein of unknown function [Candidatus Hydrogenisulfobacillus filiaventi]|uniref:Uncharacterized protein n=1 Tax=Candidatus Hydrogenisulfobacillus filiaventi TaxID=2707344 RepID=A0A6F8ZK73_9FIRM|nr:protein of unknown function [Candidatus Hydrogenisulfobacillus filiaventi]